MKSLEPPISRAVVLAAGLGSRIRLDGGELPKPLVPVSGRPLISYALHAAWKAGVDEAVVVTGYEGERIRQALGEGVPLPIRFVSNAEYERGAVSSLRAARDVSGRAPFLLLMADHVVEPALVCRLLEGAHPNGATVAADYGRRPPDYEAEATRLVIDRERGLVTAIGKGLEPWDGLDTGAFVCTEDVWRVLEAAPQACELSAVFGRMAAEGQLHVADVTGAFWYDVDTAEDLAAVEGLLGQRDFVDR